MLAGASPARRAVIAGRRLAALGAASAVVAASAVWARQVNVHLGTAAPLLGHLRLRVTPLVLPAVAVGALAVLVAPEVARRCAWRPLLAASWLLASGWAIALAATDGATGILHPLTTSDEYLPDLRHVHGLGGYLAGFTSHVHGTGPFLWSTHVSGGPPGTLLTFAIQDRLGLGGAIGTSLLVILVGTAAVPAAAVTARRVAGEDTARRALPFLACAPLAIWIATSADALFLGTSAWGVALLAIAATERGRRSDAPALLGGLLLGYALYCSYGVAPLGAVAVAVVVSARRVRPLAVGAIGVAAVSIGYAAFGFWWWDGLSATRVRYAQGLASRRPYDYFLLADLGALAIAVGPAALAGLASLPRRSRLWWPISGAVVAAAASDLSGLSKGEVERIWLPFAIWLLLGTAALGGRRAQRSWLGVQVLGALVLQVWLVTDW